MRESIDTSAITLAILAGGASSRMGTPKPALTLAGKPILQYLLDRIAWSGPTLLITAAGREHPPASDRFDREVSDDVADQGPLRGVLTALSSASTPWVLVLTVDMPCLGAKELQWLIGKATGQPDCMGMMLSRLVAGQAQTEPFPFFCRTAAAEILTRRLSEGRRSVHSLAEITGFFVEPAPRDWPLSVWTNVNTPGEWAAFLATM